jgi:hypothetical protein
VSRLTVALSPLVALLLTITVAAAQPDQTLCSHFDDGNSLGFVLVASNNLTSLAPKIEAVAKTVGLFDGPVEYSVCVSLDPRRLNTQPGGSGAVNIRTQTYSFPDLPKTPSSKVFLGRPSESGSTSIYTYQNFHGCAKARDPQLENEFHIVISGQRTASYPERRKFLFTRDVSEVCSISGQFAQFFEGLIPSPFGSALADTLTSVGTINSNTITERRSLILTFGQVTQSKFMIQRLGKMKKRQCARIEGSRIYTDSSNITEDLGYVCVSGQ